MSSSLNLDRSYTDLTPGRRHLAESKKTQSISMMNVLLTPYDARQFEKFGAHRELIMARSGKVNVAETFRHMSDFFFAYVETNQEEMSAWRPIATLKADSNKAEAKLKTIGIRLDSYDEVDRFDRYAIRFGITRLVLTYNIITFFYQKHRALMDEVMGDESKRKFYKTLQKRGNEISMRARDYINARFLLDWRNAHLFLDNAEDLTTHQELCERLFDGFNAAVAAHRSEKGIPYPMLAPFKIQRSGSRQHHIRATTVVRVLLSVPAADRCNAFASSVFTQNKTYYYNGILWAIDHYDIAKVRLLKERAESHSNATKLMHATNNTLLTREDDGFDRIQD